jgi:hypothetical protein
LIKGKKQPKVIKQTVASLFGLLVTTFILSNSCNTSFDDKVLNDSKFASGRQYETHKSIVPKVFHFDNYAFVEGNDTTSSTLGLFYGNKEILLSKHSDGVFDTIMQANLNSDGVPDFLVEYAFEDGATLLAFLSKSKTTFIEKELSSEISDYYCGDIGDTSNYIVPLTISDIDHDGKDEVIINSVKMNSKVFAIACTDTIYAGK